MRKSGPERPENDSTLACLFTSFYMTISSCHFFWRFSCLIFTSCFLPEYLDPFICSLLPFPRMFLSVYFHFSMAPSRFAGFRISDLFLYVRVSLLIFLGSFSFPFSLPLLHVWVPFVSDTITEWCFNVICVRLLVYQACFGSSFFLCSFVFISTWFWCLNIFFYRFLILECSYFSYGWKFCVSLFIQ